MHCTLACEGKLFDILLYFEIIDDEPLSLGRIFTHKITQQFVDRRLLLQNHRLYMHVFTDEFTKLVRRYFAQTFKSGDLWLAAKLTDRRLFFLFAITVYRLFLVSHPE